MSAKNRGELVDHLTDRMDAPGLGRRLADGQRDVDGLGVETRVECRALQRVASRASAAVTRSFRPLISGPCSLALLRRHAARASSASAETETASCRAPQRRTASKRRFIGRACDRAEDFRLECRHIAHPSHSGRACRSVGVRLAARLASAMQCTWAAMVRAVD